MTVLTYIIHKRLRGFVESKISRMLQNNKLYDILRVWFKLGGSNGFYVLEGRSDMGR